MSESRPSYPHQGELDTATYTESTEDFAERKREWARQTSARILASHDYDRDPAVKAVEEEARRRAGGL